MKPAIKKVFEEIVKASEDRTAKLIKTEIASVKQDLSEIVNKLEMEVASLKMDLGRANTDFRNKNF
jgi:hypothetical protein